MRRGRALVATPAVAPGPSESVDAASGKVSRSIEANASSDACVTDAATTPHTSSSTPIGSAAHSSEVLENQIVASSDHQINQAGRLMLGDAAVDADLVAAKRGIPPSPVGSCCNVATLI